jgi:membrane protein YdbS with pleckstrin-like domain
VHPAETDRYWNAIVGNGGLAFAMYGRCYENWKANVLASILIALVSLVTLFHPNDTLVWATGAITLLALIWAISVTTALLHRRCHPGPKPV